MHEVVSFFPSHRSKNPKSVQLEHVLSAFKEGYFAEAISKVRAVLEQEGEPKYKEAKKSLPAIAFCGEFSGGHGKDHLVKYNNLLVFDMVLAQFS